MSVPERRSPIVFVVDGESEDGPVGVDEGAERVGLELQILNLGYFVIQINNPAQLLGLVCVGNSVLCYVGAFIRLKQAKSDQSYSLSRRGSAR